MANDLISNAASPTKSLDGNSASDLCTIPKKQTNAEKKAYDAFHNAKQRCSNPSNPSYPAYGAGGISFLFTSFAEFIGEIGLPKVGQSLDRIDPSGNYEPGNVRWASKHVQAANKKASAQGSCASPAQFVAQALARKEAKTRRIQASANWMMMIRAINRGHFVGSDIAEAQQNELAPAALDNGWELGQTADIAEPPSYFHLPSLSMPGSLVRLVGGPFGQGAPDGGLGTIRGFGRLHPSQVLADSVSAMLPSPLFSDDGHGLLFAGPSTPGLLRFGGIEGLFLYLASRLRHGPAPKNAAMFPMLCLLDRLKELGPKWDWDKLHDAALDAGHLFIPDVQIASGGSNQLSIPQWSMLMDLIRYRNEAGHRTYLGVHSLTGLPPFIRDDLLEWLRFVEVQPVLVGGTKLVDNVAIGPVPPGLVGFEALRKILAEK